MSKNLKRADYMTNQQKVGMEGEQHRTHEACKRKTGVMRPGKTACDRAKNRAVGQ